MFRFYKIPDPEILDKIIGVDSTIKFSSAFDLNDPFELKFNLELDVDDERHKQEYFKTHPDSSDSEFDDWKEQMRGNEGFLWYNEQQKRNEFAQLISLCSFTKINTSNLMWSHYTDNHRGICVEYDKVLIEHIKLNTRFLGSCPICYSEIPPSIDIANGKEGIIEDVLFNKQNEWKYEQEHRIVIWSDQNVDYIKIPQKYIKAVYIGAKADADLVSKVHQLCKPNEIRVLYGITLGKTYGITFKETKAETFYQRSFW